MSKTLKPNILFHFVKNIFKTDSHFQINITM